MKATADCSAVNRFTFGIANADGIFSLTRSNGGNFSL